MKVTLSRAAEFFKQNNYFTLLCHANPDGDTLGSGYALCGVLHLMGKYARLRCADEPSPRFAYLKDALVPGLDVFPEGVSETIVAVDVADTELLGDLKHEYAKFDFCVDHHISNKLYAEQTLLDSSAAACAEVVWDLICELKNLLALVNDVELLLTPQVAAAVYTGVSTDTGCFRFSNTTPKSHRIAADVMEYGFDVAKINYLMFEMKTRKRLELEQKALAGVEFFYGGKCAVITLTVDMLEGIDPADTGGVSVLSKQVEGVDVGVIIKERDPAKELNAWKISLRTNTNINAQAICCTFGGGGHMRAAGCKIKGTLDEVKELVLAEIAKQVECVK
ncbi:MAG: bifunctional oligoribonuclease/PAP phosphatase NrnA [Oscillospiraceae bacterium]|nr:bifunctional oligoribonuclease/PAP phosphatase NrnA [Oscillospiraceae bacterium]